MGTATKHSALTRQSLIFLVIVFSVFHICLFMWDNDVIQHFLISKKMVKDAKRYSTSRAMSNDDLNDSSSLTSPLQFHGNTSEDSIVSYPELSAENLVNTTAVTDITATEEDAIVEEQNNDNERFTNANILQVGSSKVVYKPHEAHETLNSNDGSNVNVSFPPSKCPIQSPASKPVQVIIVTTKRSGSSFIGELFNSNRDIFYMYEPLFQVTFDVLKHRITNGQADYLIFSLWNHTLRCNYSSFSQPPQNWLERGCKLSGALKESKRLCPVKKVPNQEVGPIISELCLDRPYRVLKTIRVMDIKELRIFLEDPSLNIKILHLVRDPRAVMNSRRKLKEPNYDLLRRKGSHADEIKDLCEHMARNYRYKDEPPSWLKGKYMLVRFEDVAKNPIEQTKLIYQHLGIAMHQDVITWLNNNTHGNTEDGHKTDPFSRTRDTEKVINAWKNSISGRMREEIERKCSHVMNVLSYRPL